MTTRLMEEFEEIDQARCEAMVVNNLAIISMEISTPVFQEMIRDVKTTLPDQLANLGKDKHCLKNVFVIIDKLCY